MQKILLAILITLAGNLLLAQTYPVVWQELNRVTVNSDNSLTKNAGLTGIQHRGRKPEHDPGRTGWLSR